MVEVIQSLKESVVTSRKGRVSRNYVYEQWQESTLEVTSRKGRVSRNAAKALQMTKQYSSRPARGV